MKKLNIIIKILLHLGLGLLAVAMMVNLHDTMMYDDLPGAFKDYISLTFTSMIFLAISEFIRVLVLLWQLSKTFFTEYEIINKKEK